MSTPLQQLVACKHDACPRYGEPVQPPAAQCPACHTDTVPYLDTVPAADPPIVCPTGCTSRHLLGWESENGDGSPASTFHTGPTYLRVSIPSSPTGSTVNVGVDAFHPAGEAAEPWRVQVWGDASLSAGGVEALTQALHAAGEWVQGARRRTMTPAAQVGVYRQSAVDILNAGPPPEWGPGPHYGWALGVVKASLPPATQEALQRFLDRPHESVEKGGPRIRDLVLNQNEI